MVDDRNGNGNGEEPPEHEPDPPEHEPDPPEPDRPLEPDHEEAGYQGPEPGETGQITPDETR